VRKDGTDLYHGVLRAVDHEGKKILHDVDYQSISNISMKKSNHGDISSLSEEIGKNNGWYTVDHWPA
jgi:hypothetical protein